MRLISVARPLVTIYNKSIAYFFLTFFSVWIRTTCWWWHAEHIHQKIKIIQMSKNFEKEKQVSKCCFGCFFLSLSNIFCVCFSLTMLLSFSFNLIPFKVVIVYTRSCLEIAHLIFRWKSTRKNITLTTIKIK